MSVTISGQAQVLAAMNLAVAGLTDATDRAIQSAGLACEADAKGRCPVDTGRLRASIEYQRTGLCECQVGTNVSYAPYVELGHHTRSGSWVPAQPFLFPAYAQAVSDLKDTLVKL